MSEYWYLECVGTSSIFELKGECMSVGRNKLANILCSSTYVSKNHAELFIKNGELYIKDCNSSNGTFCNDKKLTSCKLYKLVENDELGFGIIRSEVQDANSKNNIYIVKRGGTQNRSSIDLLNDLDDTFYVKNIKNSPVAIKSVDSLESSTSKIDSPQDVKTVIKIEVIEDQENYNAIAVTNEIKLEVPLMNVKSENDAVFPEIKKEKYDDDKLDLKIEKNKTDLDYNIVMKLPKKLKCDTENGIIKNNEEKFTERSGYTIQDNCIVIDDDDDFTCSQMLNSQLYNKNEVLSDSIFCQIKQEIAEMDQVDGLLNPVLIDDNDDENDNDVLKWLQCTPENISSNVNTNNNATATSSKTLDDHSNRTNSTLKQHEIVGFSGNGLIGDNVTSSKGKKPPMIIEPHIMLKKIQKKVGTEKKCTQPAKLKRSYKRQSAEISSTLHAEKPSTSVNNNTAGIMQTDEINIPSTSTAVKKRPGRKKKVVSDFKVPNASKQNVTKNISQTPNEGLSDRITNKVATVEPLAKKRKVADDEYIELRKQKLKEIALKEQNHKNMANGGLEINVDDEIMQILSWSPHWLEEQKVKTHAPPIISYNILRMKQTFDSYQEYYKIVVALLLLEVWYYVYKEWLTSKITFKLQVLTEIKERNRVILKCITYITEEDNKHQQFVKEGDLILIDLRLIIKGNSYLKTVFGYVGKCSKSRLYSNEQIHFNDIVADTLKSIPRYKLELEVITKMYEGTTAEDKLSTCKVLTSMITTVRMFKSLKCLKYSSLCKFIVNPNILDFHIPQIPYQKLASQDLLNPTQLMIVMEATHICLRKQPGMYLIQGPPGTGKTTVITNIVQQILYGGNNVTPAPILVVAPSNAAVDELVLRFITHVKPKLNEAQQKELKLIRIGSRAAVNEAVRDYFLEDMVRSNIKRDLLHTNHDAKQCYLKLLKEREVLEENLKTTKVKNANTEIVKKKLDDCKDKIMYFGKHYYSKAFSLYNEKHKTMESKLLLGARIICTTLSSCVSKTLDDVFKRAKIKFTCCIIDEVAQSSEPETLIPVALGIDKLVLVGDPQQLPGMVVSPDARKLGFAQSVFTRIKNNFDEQINNPIKMLDYQYRMHPEICYFANKEYYKGQLKSSYTASALLSQIWPYLVFNINTDYKNQCYQNDTEVDFVCNLLKTVLNILKLKENKKLSVGIVTPYNNQKDAINNKLKTLSFPSTVSIMVNTVDSFQGKEKDLMIMSCVRFVPNTFLSNEQRVNVAITRAKHILFVVGTQSLFQHCSVLGKLKDDAKKRNLLHQINDINQDLTKTLCKKR